MMYPLLSILSSASGTSSRIQLSDLPGGFETPLSVGLTLQTSRRSSNRKGLYLMIFLRRFVILISLCLDLQVHEVSR